MLFVVISQCVALNLCLAYPFALGLAQQFAQLQQFLKRDAEEEEEEDDEKPTTQRERERERERGREQSWKRWTVYRMMVMMMVVIPHKTWRLDQCC